MTLPATLDVGPALQVDYQTDPAHYRHWRLRIDGSTATLSLDVAEDGGIRAGYKLKLNSYDLGVDIELHDALNRIRFEHPTVRTVIVTSAKDRIFCSGANIFMLGLSTHAWKVNFCKFTNETRNGIEDSSRFDGIKFLAAVNGACAGGGYEMALACDRILLVDDRSSSVSLPEVPLLGVLPGTGGLTRITDKRRVRHDHADLFCTSVEGVRGSRAKHWRLVDEIAKPAAFEAAIKAEVDALSAASTRPAHAEGVALTPIARVVSADGVEYTNVSIRIERDKRIAHLTVRAPSTAQPGDIAGIVASGCRWWPLQMGRELDDAILHLRSNELDIGTWLLRTEGSAEAVLACDAALEAHHDHWFVTATRGLLRRCLARLDVSSRTLFALIEQGSCFAGTLAELAFAADRSYMQLLPENGPTLQLSALNFGAWPMVSRKTRLERRFHDEAAPLAAVERTIGQPLDADAAMRLGLITANPDDIDWADEIRMACEERAAMSPDALTGLEANLRFGPGETLETRVFGRLSAWQNWIFIRPNAVGDKGALKVYGRGEKAAFDLNRV